MPVKKGEITTAAWTEPVVVDDDGTIADVQATKGNGLAMEIYQAIRNTGALDNIDSITKVTNQAEIDAGRENVNEDGHPDPIIIDPIMGPNPEKQEEANLLWVRVSESIANAVVQHITVGGDNGGSYYDNTGEDNPPSGPLQSYEAEDQIIYLKNRVKDLSDELQNQNVKILELSGLLNETNDNIDTLIAALLLEAAQRTATQVFIITALAECKEDMATSALWTQQFVEALGSILMGDPLNWANQWGDFVATHAITSGAWAESVATMDALMTSLAGVGALDIANAGLIADAKSTTNDNIEAVSEWQPTLQTIVDACEALEELLDTIGEGDADNVI